MQYHLTNMERAAVLTAALPYIRKYTGQIVVVKYGGNAMINEQLKQQVMEDIVLLWLIGVRVVLVHGGGPEINELMDRLGKKPEFIGGLRVTDKETMDIVQMVLAGKINKTLVNLLEMKGGKAIGLSGMDGRLLQCSVKDERLGFVGEIQKVHINPVTDLLDNGYIPVVSTVGCDKSGNAYNINGDTAAAYIAGALGAKTLIMMTDISGVLRNREDPSTLWMIWCMTPLSFWHRMRTRTGPGKYLRNAGPGDRRRKRSARKISSLPIRRWILLKIRHSATL